MNRFKKIGLIAATVVLLLALVLARMPVSCANWFLPQNVSLVQASGTLWNGRASAIGLEGVVLQQNMVWQFEPKALLAGGLAWQINGNDGEIPSQARLVLGWRGVALENVAISLPLEGVFRAMPKVAAWGLGGKAVLRSARLSKNPGDSAELILDPVYSQLVPALMPITALRANFNVVADGVQWSILPAGASAVAIDGRGNVLWAGLTAKGEINLKPDDAVKQQLAPLLFQVPATAHGYQIRF